MAPVYSHSYEVDQVRAALVAMRRDCGAQARDYKVDEIWSTVETWTREYARIYKADEMIAVLVNMG